MVIEEAFDPAKQHAQETVFAVGNGYVGTRGTFEEGYPGEWRATLVHGLFDSVPTFASELVNVPDWTHCRLFVNGEPVRLDRGRARHYRRELSLANGRLTRRFTWKGKGPAVAVTFQRAAALHEPHLVALEVRVEALEEAADVELRAGLPAHMDNLGWLHWDVVDQGTDGETIWLRTRTRSTGIEVALAARLTADRPAHAETWPADGCPTQVFRLRLLPGESVTVTKVVALVTSREANAPLARALELVSHTPRDFHAILLASAVRWAELWEACDVRIEGDPRAQLATRYNIFQLLAVGPERDVDASIGAKGLSGFGYRGHVFWDTEIFMLPFFAFTRPHVARHLLLYRYRRLEGARRKATRNGYTGAQFPWESADTGDEVTPTWVVDPDDPTKLIRIWTGDIQIHITADVAYAVLLYWRVTGDDEFLLRCGAEIVLDGATFWASRAEYNAARDRYEYTDVIGPDEYHDHVDNNAFTNGMARWHLRQALGLLEWLAEHAPQRHAELVTQLGLTPERLAHWRDVADKLHVPVGESGLIEQFEGYFQLEDVDLATLEPRDCSVQVLLGIEGVARTQVIKQPDVLMWLYLFRDAPWMTPELLQANSAYYNPRTDHTHGSSLGPAIMAALAARMGLAEEAYEHFMRAALVDLHDTRHNTADGLHAASAGGIWQALVFGFAGVRLTDNGPVVERPCLPPAWQRLRFRLRHRGEWFDVDLTRPSCAEPSPDVRDPDGRVPQHVEPQKGGEK
ncbi:MAG: glycoside hydrolase family 65 protein [Ardenticatenia bacterium]|nr:glycoside hydrolase family 65 protein [Ardenticatenia bacterium]